MTDDSNNERRTVGSGRWKPTLEDPLGRNQQGRKHQSPDSTPPRKADGSGGSSSGPRSSGPEPDERVEMDTNDQEREPERERDQYRDAPLDWRGSRLITALLAVIATLLLVLLIAGTTGTFFGSDEAAGDDEGFAGDVDTGSETVDVFVETVVEVVVDVFVEPARDFVIFVEQLIVEWVEIAIEYVESGNSAATTHVR